MFLTTNIGLVLRATWNLIKPWAEEGKLPTFKKFIEELKRVYRILKPGGYAVIPMENLAS